MSVSRPTTARPTNRARKSRAPDRRTVATRQRILDEAERLFASAGYHGVSMREINAAAGLNVAAVHYHFNDKHQLLDEVLARRLDPISRHATEALRACRSGSLPRRRQVEEMVRIIADAFIAGTEGPRGQVVAELLNRALGETDRKLAKLANHRFDTIWDELHPIIQAALLHLPTATAYWRVYFVLGSIMRLIRRNRSKGLCDPRDVEAGKAELIRYASAALLAPAAP